MAQRTFVDESGAEWRVWDVQPQWAERRRAERRAAREAREARARAAAERRRERDRRRLVSAEPRVRVTEGFEKGWLTFESDCEKRRLAPIPPGWLDAPETLLAQLCRRAAPVAARFGRLIE